MGWSLVLYAGRNALIGIWLMPEKDEASDRHRGSAYSRFHLVFNLLDIGVAGDWLPSYYLGVS